MHYKQMRRVSFYMKWLRWISFTYHRCYYTIFLLKLLSSRYPMLQVRSIHMLNANGFLHFHRNEDNLNSLYNNFVCILYIWDDLLDISWSNCDFYFKLGNIITWSPTRGRVDLRLKQEKNHFNTLKNTFKFQHVIVMVMDLLIDFFKKWLPHLIICYNLQFDAM